MRIFTCYLPYSPSLAHILPDVRESRKRKRFSSFRDHEGLQKWMDTLLIVNYYDRLEEV